MHVDPHLAAPRPARTVWRRRLLAILGAGALALAWLTVAQAPAAYANATATPVADPDSFVCDQPTSIGFEDFADDTDLSAQTFGGVDFTTTGGYTWRVIDFNSGNYNGKYPYGAYTAQGSHSAWLGTSQGSGRISFGQRASTVSLLVSSYTPITMEAYAADGTLLESTPFSRSNTGTGQMDLLKITRPRAEISSVVVHDTGNYFTVDSLCTNAAITTPGTDLSITKNDEVDPIAAGDTETFDLVVTNNGPLDTSTVDVGDQVPAGFSVVSAVPSQGTCPGSGNSVVCNLGALTVGASATVTVSATAATAGTWTNTAQVGSDAADPNPDDNTATITTTINGQPSCTITGTPRNDTLSGTPGDDVICGLAGNDTIRSSGGADLIVGGVGVDTVSYAGDPGPVTVDMKTASGTTTSGTQQLIGVENLIGSPGNDLLGGDDFNNTIDGGAGDDRLVGGAGNDLIRGGADNDQLFLGPGANGGDGGPGEDTLRYGAALGPVIADLGTGVGTSTVTLNDTFVGVEDLVGSRYDDTLSGDEGPNIVDGGQGNDQMFGHGGDDAESGAAGADTIYGGAGTNTLDGGAGTDTVSYGSATVPITASLTLQSGQGTGVLDQLSGFENLDGSKFADILTGDSGANQITGGDGNDLLSGKAGNDVLDGQAGNDQVSFSGAGAAVIASLVTSSAQGEGSDTLTSIEGLIGGTAADRLTGNGGANTLAGGGGNDQLSGLGGNDQLAGEGGNDSLSGGLGMDNLDGGNGADDLDGGPNTDTCSQGPGHGTIVNCEG